jgi:hypothetical protein
MSALSQKIEMKPRVTMQQVHEDCDWLGTVIAVHSIGEYDFVEYLSKPASNATDKTRRIAFSTYIGGERTSRSYSSLDEALVGVIARKYDGLNTQADRLFMRGIGAP